MGEEGSTFCPTASTEWVEGGRERERKIACVPSLALAVVLLAQPSFSS
jgi:hypothetical protein